LGACFSQDLDGLSRYYSVASAHLRHGAPHGHMALKSLKPAREMSLAQVPTQMLGQDQDWHEQKWSPQHYVNVAASRVDDATAKGIWKSKDEAWSGIDEVKVLHQCICVCGVQTLRPCSVRPCPTLNIFARAGAADRHSL